MKCLSYVQRKWKLAKKNQNYRQFWCLMQFKKECLILVTNLLWIHYGALPHAQVTDRKFKKGDLVVVDLTLRYKGYVSDSTRTFGIGNVSSKAKEVYEIVKESQKLGLNTVKPNTDCKTVDLSCRKFIDQQKFGDYFIHSTGHGIGLEVHELPTISHKSKTKLKQNMAITVEPGIYIPNKFGVRIEDSLIVKDRPIIMHKFTKDLVTV